MRNPPPQIDLRSTVLDLWRRLHLHTRIGIITLLVWRSIMIVLKHRIELDKANRRQEFLTLTMEEFLRNLQRESPMRLTSDYLKLATNNYSTRLGSGGFGSVYKGTFSDDGSVVGAVKVLNGIFNERMEEQFKAEVGTIGKVRHLNLVRLIGFCIENNMAALVYEYMSNGSLDKYLFSEDKTLAFDKLHEIAVGIAKGIAYLHEECQERVIHYDIKPENILLDDKLCPKVADFGLAKLCDREKSYVTMTGHRGTYGYMAPELVVPIRATHKVDVCSFGILLFEIIARKRNLDESFPSESQQWFPLRVWKMFDGENLQQLITDCDIGDIHREIAERMVNIALWCVQYRPERRPKMSDVVNMLEGSMDIPERPSNPFQHLMGENRGITKAALMDNTTSGP